MARVLYVFVRVRKGTARTRFRYVCSFTRHATQWVHPTWQPPPTHEIRNKAHRTTHSKFIVLSPSGVRLPLVIALHQRRDVAIGARVGAFALDGRCRENFDQSGFGTRVGRSLRALDPTWAGLIARSYLCYLGYLCSLEMERSSLLSSKTRYLYDTYWVLDICS